MAQKFYLLCARIVLTGLFPVLIGVSIIGTTFLFFQVADHLPTEEWIRSLLAPFGLVLSDGAASNMLLHLPPAVLFTVVIMLPVGMMFEGEEYLDYLPEYLHRRSRAIAKRHPEFSGVLDSLRSADISYLREWIRNYDSNESRVRSIQGAGQGKTAAIGIDRGKRPCDGSLGGRNAKDINCQNQHKRNERFVPRFFNRIVE